MRLVIATPLYPPDIAPSAAYAKELARRLAKEHEVTVVAYARHPEAVPGVHAHAVDKHRPLLLRIPAFFFALRRAARSADAVIIENGASVELPAGLLARMLSVPFLYHISDTAAHTDSKTRFIRSRITRFMERASRAIVHDLPPPRPELLPFTPPPTAAIEAYEAAWKDHLKRMLSALSL